MAINKERLKQSWNKACNDYLRAFCQKHGYDYEDAERAWVAGDVGSVADISDMYISMDDIRTDIDMEAAENEYVEYYDYCTELDSLTNGMLKCMNYESWLRGAPRYSEEYFENLRVLKARAEAARKELEEAIEKAKEV